ncbi:MAG: DUF6141 family protein [Thermoplasmata archaeon]
MDLARGARSAALVWVLLAFALADGLTTGVGPDLVVVLIWLAIGIGLPLLWLLSSLTVEIRDRLLYVRYIPFFVFRRMPLSEIRSYEARVYNPLTEYGGWGVRFAPGKKRVYSVGGNQGVELHLVDGTRLMIGSRDPEALVRALDAARVSTTP